MIDVAARAEWIAAPQHTPGVRQSLLAAALAEAWEAGRAERQASETAYAADIERIDQPNPFRRTT